MFFLFCHIRKKHTNTKMFTGENRFPSKQLNPLELLTPEQPTNPDPYSTLFEWLSLFAILWCSNDNMAIKQCTHKNWCSSDAQYSQKSTTQINENKGKSQTKVQIHTRTMIEHRRLRKENNNNNAHHWKVSGWLRRALKNAYKNNKRKKPREIEREREKLKQHRLT